MEIALAVIGTAFAAFCIWLLVRIVNRRKKPGVAFWATVVLAAAVLYVLSTGPACWLYTSLGYPASANRPIKIIYAPIWFAQDNGPNWMNDGIRTYVNWWAND